MIITIYYFLQQLLLYPLLNLDVRPPAKPPKPKRRHRMWAKPWILERDKAVYTTFMADLYNTDMPGFRNYIRMTPNRMLKERLAPRLRKRRTNWREKLEADFRLRWNVPHAIGALDGKHVTIRKPPKSGSLYHNYKGFFSVVLMALIDVDYRFRRENVGTVGSCSDAQIFNDTELKEKIEDDSIGFPEASDIELGGPDVPYFILVNNAFTLKPG